MSYDQNLAIDGAIDRIEQLEAELAEKGAALAAAHEALRDTADDCGDCSGHGSYGTAEHDPGCDGSCRNCPVEVEVQCERCAPLLAALSAPALQRAAEELRLLREVEVEVGGKDDVAATPGCDCLVCTNNQRMNPAWFALRRFREEQG